MTVALALLVVALGVGVGLLFREASDLRDDLHRQEDQIDSLRFEVDEHSSEIEDLQSSVDDLQSSFDDLDTRVSDLEPPVSRRRWQSFLGIASLRLSAAVPDLRELIHVGELAAGRAGHGDADPRLGRSAQAGGVPAG
jgi:predicted nuclease with TOPRIM domain